MSFSHDYPDDTHLTYTRSGNNAHLVLSFQSEDPDMGTEEMEYNSDGGESFAELLSDARSELTSYLDRQDTSSFYEQQGVSRTSLYAFENAMRAAEHEKPSVMAELKRLSSRSVPEKDSIGMER